MGPNNFLPSQFSAFWFQKNPFQQPWRKPTSRKELRYFWPYAEVKGSEPETKLLVMSYHETFIYVCKSWRHTDRVTITDYNTSATPRRDSAEVLRKFCNLFVTLYSSTLLHFYAFKKRKYFYAEVKGSEPKSKLLVMSYRETFIYVCKLWRHTDRVTNGLKALLYWSFWRDSRMRGGGQNSSAYT